MVPPSLGSVSSCSPVKSAPLILVPGTGVASFTGEHTHTGLMNIPMGLSSQHTLIQVSVVSGGLFRVPLTTVSLLVATGGHRARRGFQCQHGFHGRPRTPHGRCRVPGSLQVSTICSVTETALLSPGAAKQTGDSGVDL